MMRACICGRNYRSTGEFVLFPDGKGGLSRIRVCPKCARGTLRILPAAALPDIVLPPNNDRVPGFTTQLEFSQPAPGDAVAATEITTDLLARWPACPDAPAWVREAVRRLQNIAAHTRASAPGVEYDDAYAEGVLRAASLIEVALADAEDAVSLDVTQEQRQPARKVKK